MFEFPVPHGFTRDGIFLLSESGDTYYLAHRKYYRVPDAQRRKRIANENKIFMSASWLIFLLLFFLVSAYSPSLTLSLIVYVAASMIWVLAHNLQRKCVVRDLEAGPIYAWPGYLGICAQMSKGRNPALFYGGAALFLMGAVYLLALLPLSYTYYTEISKDVALSNEYLLNPTREISRPGLAVDADGALVVLPTNQIEARKNLKAQLMSDQIKQADSVTLMVILTGFALACLALTSLCIYMARESRKRPNGNQSL